MAFFFLVVQFDCTAFPRRAQSIENQCTTIRLRTIPIVRFASIITMAYGTDYLCPPGVCEHACVCKQYTEYSCKPYLTLTQ